MNNEVKKMKRTITRIIKEEIENIMSEKKWKSAFDYLSPFKYVGYFTEDSKNEWVFFLSYNSNKITVWIVQKNNDWYFDIEFDGKGVEHDAKFTFGPYSDFENFIKEVNKKLYNNLQFSTGNLRNEKNDLENDDLLIRFNLLLSKEEDLMSLKDGVLEDLKKLCSTIKRLQYLTGRKFIEAIKSKYNDVKGITNALNKIEQIDYYKKFNNFFNENYEQGNSINSQRLNNHTFEWVDINTAWEYREFDRSNSAENRADSEDSIERLKESLQDGFREPLIMQYSHKYKTAYITEGNHRLYVAKLLGYKFVPIRVTTDGYEKKDAKSVVGYYASLKDAINVELPSEIGIPNCYDKDFKSIPSEKQKYEDEIEIDFDKFDDVKKEGDIIKYKSEYGNFLFFDSYDFEYLEQVLNDENIFEKENVLSYIRDDENLKEKLEKYIPQIKEDSEYFYDEFLETPKWKEIKKGIANILWKKLREDVINTLYDKFDTPYGGTLRLKGIELSETNYNNKTRLHLSVDYIELRGEDFSQYIFNGNEKSFEEILRKNYYYDGIKMNFKEIHDYFIYSKEIDIDKFFKNPLDESYKGEHRAPSNDGFSCAMHDVESCFPSFYTKDAYKYYGGYDDDDKITIGQIQSVHNKPNKLITIYRAVPNLNKEIEDKIKVLTDITKFYNKYNFLPTKKQVIYSLQDDIEKENPEISYDELERQILDKIYKEIELLMLSKKKPLKINDGDWVTTSKLYAKNHGESSLNNNYKIIKKVVKASELYTNGDSVSEWGYSSK